MRLIDADKLIADIENSWDWLSLNSITASTVLRQTITDIQNAPTVNEIPSEWIIDNKTDYRIWSCHCSNCGKDPQNYIGGTEDWWLVRLPDYCPNCGTKMKRGNK